MFDKTFFKLALGFMAIIAVGVFALYGTGRFTAQTADVQAVTGR